ncbi:MAG: hypothetical protein FWG99_05670 [Treponema sp.]|nr:hypothetical protein [Treponema sp.]
MKIKGFIFVLFLIIIITSCGSSNIKNTISEISGIMSESSDALEVVLEKLQEADIIFIGGASHLLLNEKLFLNSSLQLLYDAGVRYIFAEGGIENGPIYTDEWLLKKAVLLFYPWEYVGVRYGVDDLRNEIFLLNSNKKERDKIKYIGLESGREDFISGAYDPVMLNNYRDEYMAKIAFHFIDNAAPGEKFIVIGGGLHGSTKIIPDAFGSSDTWTPLGVYLKEKYEDNYLSLCYITLDENIADDDSYKAMLNSKEWEDITNMPKFITALKTEKLHEIIPVLYSPGFDGYIVDKNGIKGIMYSYALFDPSVLTEVIALTKKYDENIFNLSEQNILNYNDPEIYYTIKII